MNDLGYFANQPATPVLVLGEGILSVYETSKTVRMDSYQGSKILRYAIKGPSFGKNTV